MEDEEDEDVQGGEGTAAVDAGTCRVDNDEQTARAAVEIVIGAAVEVEKKARARGRRTRG